MKIKQTKQLNYFRKLLPKGVLSSRKELEKLSKISIDAPQDLPPENLKIVHKITAKSWAKNCKEIHNATNKEIK